MTLKMILTAAVVTSSLALVPVQSGGRPQAPAAAEHEQHHPPAPEATSQGSSRPGPMMGGMAEMDAMNKKLDELVARMRSATGPAKVDAIAEVVTALVDQHKDMHKRMNDMPMMQRMSR